MPPKLPDPLIDPAFVLRTADLSHRKDTRFNVAPLPETVQALRTELTVDALRKVSFRGVIQPVGSRNFRLRAEMGATVVQPCVVTLAPVSTRITADVERFYVSDMTPPEAVETEMPEDDTLEELPDEINLIDVLAEALSLNLPAYPRAADADSQEMVFTEPGKEAMRDQDVKPFAGLAALRDRLQSDEDT